MSLFLRDFIQSWKTIRGYSMYNIDEKVFVFLLLFSYHSYCLATHTQRMYHFYWIKKEESILYFAKLDCLS